MPPHLVPADGAAVRVRQPGADGPGSAQFELERAYVRSRQDALSILSSLLGGLDVDGHAQRSDGGTLELGQGAAELVERFDPEGMLDRLLTQGDLGEGRVNLLKDGERVEASRMLDVLRPEGGPTRSPAGHVAAALMTGHTIVLDGIDRRDTTMRRFNELVSCAFRSLVNINAYISYRPHGSFGLHWDDHEVMIVQLIGRKNWSVHQTTALSPVQLTHSTYDAGPLAWTGQLTPGQILWVPRGWAHDPTGLDELTCHLTVTIPRPSVGAMVERALSLLDLEWDSTSFDEVLLGRLLSEKITRHDTLARTIATFRTSLVASAPAAPRAWLAAMCDQAAFDESLVRSPHPGGVLLADGPDGEPYLVFSRRSVRCTHDALDVLPTILDGRVRSLGRIVAESPKPCTAEAVLRDALRFGLIEVVRDADEWGLVRGDGP